MKIKSLYKSSVFGTQWIALAAMLLISGLLLALDAYRGREATLAAETHRIVAATRVVQLSLEESLHRADNIMLALRQEIQGSSPMDAVFNVRLQTLTEAMPMIRSLNVHDANGTIVATSRPEILGMNQNFMAREYFKKPQQGKTETLFITPPFLSTTAAYTLVISRRLIDQNGVFSGVIAASLEPAKFLPLLESVRYADDMLVSIHHSAGVLFGIAPVSRADLIGKNLAQPGSLFLAMRDSGLTENVMQGRQIATGQIRLMTQNEINPHERDVDQYITVGISRLVDDVLAPWQRETGIKAAIWLAFSLVLIISLSSHQRRVTRIKLRETQALQALKSSERFMRTMTDNIPGLVGYWNADLTCGFSNAAYQDYFGKSSKQMMNIPMQELLGDVLFTKNEPMIRAALLGEPQRFEQTLNKVDGRVVFTWAQYVPDVHDGQVHGFFVLVSDVSDLKRAELALEESNQFAKTTFDTVPETICVLDKTGGIIAVNKAWRDFYDANDDNPQSVNYALGTNYLQVCESAIGANAAEAPEMAQGLAAVLKGERDLFSIEYPCHSPNEKRFFFARVKRFAGDSGHVLVAHGNITERKLIELELARLAHTDMLTSLCNRRHYMELSEIELSRTARHGGPLSLLMLDIDHFKRVNDTHGHHVGDTVIQKLAAVCRDQLRDLDVIGRLGGEEFAVTMPQTDQAQAMQIAERLRRAIEAASVPLPKGLPVRFTISIGVTTLASSQTNLETLLDQADQALYRAKNSGRNRVCSFLEMD